jgi:hypothetical protein
MALFTTPLRLDIHWGCLYTAIPWQKFQEANCLVSYMWPIEVWFYIQHRSQELNRGAENSSCRCHALFRFKYIVYIFCWQTLDVLFFYERAANSYTQSRGDSAEWKLRLEEEHQWCFESYMYIHVAHWETESPLARTWKLWKYANCRYMYMYVCVRVFHTCTVHSTM